MKRSSNKGFTLVELIIVIAILAIIMLIAIPNFSGIQQRMQVRADKQTAAQIGKAIRIWYAERVSEGAPVDSLYTLGTSTDADTGVVSTDGKIYSGSTDKTTEGLCPYSKLDGIVDYISTTNAPTSLSNSNGAKVDKQMYAPILTSRDRTAKIIMVIQKADNSAVEDDDSADKTDTTIVWKPTADVDITTLSVDYDGSKAGIAYIEP